MEILIEPRPDDAGARQTCVGRSLRKPAFGTALLLLLAAGISICDMGCGGGGSPRKSSSLTAVSRALTLGDVWTYDATEQSTATTGATSVTGSMTVSISNYVAGTVPAATPGPTHEFVESHAFTGTDATGATVTSLESLFVHADATTPGNVDLDGKNSAGSVFLTHGLSTMGQPELIAGAGLGGTNVSGATTPSVVIERPGAWPTSTTNFDWSGSATFQIPYLSGSAGSETLTVQNVTGGTESVITPAGIFDAYVVQVTRTDYIPVANPAAASSSAPDPTDAAGSAAAPSPTPALSPATVTIGTWYYVPDYGLPVEIQESFTDYAHSTTGTRTLKLHSVNFKPVAQPTATPSPSGSTPATEHR